MLFDQLKGNLKNANSTPPAMSCVALGFTQAQMLTMKLNKPRLIWYDALTKTFYDQGDSTKIKKANWLKVNANNFNKDVPMNNLKYYIPINGMMVEESNKPLE